MSTLREGHRTAEFILSEEGTSRARGVVAEGLQLEAGRVVEKNEDDELIAYTAGETAAAGILIYPVDSRAGAVAATYLARKARVAFEDLTYPDDEAATTAAALADLGITVSPLPLSVGEGGGGGNTYVASAVHFDGTQSLFCPSLSCSDNGVVSFVALVKIKQADLVGTNIFWVSDPENSYGTWAGFYDQSSETPGPGLKSIIIANSDGSILLDMGDQVLPEETWACIIYSANLNSATPKPGKIYFGDTDTAGAVDDGGSGPAVTAINGNTFYVSADSYGTPGLKGDFADIRIMPGISLLDGSGDIPLATRRLFIDENGKPVDPAIATAAIGASAILFSGGASTFAKNQGTGGAFTLTGSLTNATTSPSDAG